MRERDGYYSWTDPRDGTEYGMGRDRREAIAQVMEVLVKRADEPRMRLVDRIGGDEARTWTKWCDEFDKLIAERTLKHNTKLARRSQMKRLRSLFAKEKPAASVTTLELANVIRDLKAQGKQRTAQAFRAFLVDCFRRMVANGWRADNPAEVLDEVSVRVKRARLQFDVFLSLYKATKNVRLRNAMALAIVSGQPRECVAAAKFADFRDGGWWNERGKTGVRIVIPMDLRLDCFGMSLEEVVKQCRATGVLSKHAIHQVLAGPGRRLGHPTHVEQLTRDFTAELAKLGLVWGDKSPPTFHEIRSLSGRLYKAQGNVSAQELLGHRNARTTDIYTDERGEWLRVRVRGTTV